MYMVFTLRKIRAEQNFMTLLRQSNYTPISIQLRAPPLTLQATHCQHTSAAMDIAHSINSQAAGLSFSFLTSDDVKSISVKKIDNPLLLDNLGLPTKGGLYDPKLGPMSARDV
jgi:hypothetical protein